MGGTSVEEGTVAQLDHPGVVSVLDVGTIEPSAAATPIRQ